ncbi:MAG TPA: MBL fold metallo-hydrolase [Acidimicrobiia bacterium]|nr:MBL fold metallo-hydrolase [Acidimicrobiia bacterium]
MVRIVDGVYQVSKGVNSFIIDGDGGVVLIDAGLPRFHGSIEKGLNGIGRSILDVRAVLITHAHIDHVGGLARIRGGSGAEVYASTGDAPAVEGEVPVTLPPFVDRMPVIRPVFRLMPRATPVDEDHRVSPGPIDDLPEDLTVIGTPGHTPGHVSFLLDRSGGVMFVGDAATRSRGGEIRRGWMNRATPQFDESLRRLAEHEFEVACFGHAAPITEAASSMFQRFVTSIR